MRIYITANFKNQRLLDEGWVKQALKELASEESTPGSNKKMLKSFKENVYSIRANDKARIVFAYAKIHNEQSIFLLDVLPNHDIPQNNHYDNQVRMIREMASENTEDVKELDEKEILSALDNGQHTPIYEFNHNGIILSDAQHDLINAQLPLLINGPPGSGKTSTLFVILARLIENNLDDSSKKYLYVARSKALAKFMQNEWDKSDYANIARSNGNLSIEFKYANCNSYQEVDEDFLYYELIKESMLKSLNNDSKIIPLNLTKKDTKEWFDEKIKSLKIIKKLSIESDIDFEKFMQEKDILTDLDRDYYLGNDLGKRNSLFGPLQRELVYTLYLDYLKYEEIQGINNKIFDFSLHKISMMGELGKDNIYDLIMVDETQDFSLGQLKDLKQLSRNNNIILSIDTNQDLEKGLSLRPHIKRIFTINGNCSLTSHSLLTSFRCPQSIIDVSNCLISLKHKATHGIADKAEYTQFKPEPGYKEKGTLSFVNSKSIPNTQTILKKFKDTDVVVVAHQDKINEAQDIFKNYTIFTPGEIKGLEFQCVISYQLFDTELFKQANKELKAKNTKNVVNRAKNDESKPFFAPGFNEAFTAFTRAQDSLIIVQEKSNDIENILNPLRNVAKSINKDKDKQIILNEKYAIEESSGNMRETTIEDWQNQVSQLKLQGKDEKAKEVYEKRLEKILKITFSEYEKKHNVSSILSNENLSPQNSALRIIDNIESAQAPSIRVTYEQKTPLGVSNNVPGIIPLLENNSKRSKNSMPSSSDGVRMVSNVVRIRPTIASNINMNNLIEKGNFLFKKYNSKILALILNQLNFEDLHTFLCIIRLPAFGKASLYEIINSDLNSKQHFESMCTINPELNRALFSLEELKVIDSIFADISNLKKSSKKACSKIIRTIVDFHNSHQSLVNHIVNEEGRTLLSLSIIKNQFEITKELLKIDGININKIENDGLNPLLIAVGSGNHLITKILLKNPKIQVNNIHHDGTTPLVAALKNGEIEIFKLLLQHPDINVNMVNLDGSTILYHAINPCQIEFINALLDKPEIDVNIVNAITRVTPLLLAVDKGIIGAIKALLNSHNIDVNKTYSEGWSPLLIAIERNNYDSFNLLINRPEIDINQANLEGLTPLSLAIEMGNLKILNALVQRSDIQVNIFDESGSTPLIQAVMKANINVIECLLRIPDINVNMVFNNGWTPLLQAVSVGDIRIVNLLLEMPGIDVNMADTIGWSPLIIAINESNYEALNQLLKSPRIDVNLEDDEGMTPLFHAVNNNDMQAIMTLLHTNGIDVNIPNIDDCTPLYEAVRNENIDAVEALLNMPGININIADCEGTTPLLLAEKNNLTEIIVMIKQAELNQNGLSNMNHLAQTEQAAHNDIGFFTNTTQTRFDPILNSSANTEEDEMKIGKPTK